MKEFRLGKEKEFEEISLLYEKCKQDLLKKNIFQWGQWYNNYPNKEFIKIALNNNELFVLTLSDRIIGSVILNQDQSIEWNDIIWTSDSDKSLVIHAMIIDPKMQGRGFGSKLLEYCEKHAIVQGFKYTRLDAFKKNITSNQLYNNKNYKNLGSVIFDKKPENNKEYYCYEKSL